jgi:hypothetical protein
VRFLADGQESVGTLHNVSRAGVGIRSAEVPRPGAIVALSFESPHGVLVDARGEVRWNTRGLASGRVPEGFGVRLHEPPREFRDFFTWALEQGGDREADSVDL